MKLISKKFFGILIVMLFCFGCEEGEDSAKTLE